jgi:tRNA wybutosine-synthesizing protein 4
VGGKAETLESPWKFLGILDDVGSKYAPNTSSALPCPVEKRTVVPRVKIKCADDFHETLNAKKPVILDGLNLGECTKRWTTSYLKQQVGVDRQVSY